MTQIERLLRSKLNPLLIPSYDPKASPEDLKKYPEKGLFVQITFMLHSLILTSEYMNVNV